MPSEIGSFTPIPHLLAKEVGLVRAAVYGAVWRYCQMKDGVCKASFETIGDDIGVDRATVMRSIKKLCELGYLIDQTPDRRNAPHTYIVSKSVAECNSLEAETVAQDNSSRPTVADCNATVAESQLSIDSKIESKKERARDFLGDVFNKQGQTSTSTGPNPQDQYFGSRDEFLKIYQEMTGAYPDRVEKDEIIRVAQAGQVTAEIWREGWRTTKLNWTGRSKNPPIARVVEVCEKADGDYETFKQLKWPEPANGRDSPSQGLGQGRVTFPATIRNKDGSIN